MRKFLLAFAALLIGGVVSAQPIGVRVVKDTVNGRVLVKADDGTWLAVYGSGAPSFSTFLGDNVPEGAVYFDTANGTSYGRASSTWTASPAGSVAFSGVTTGTNTVTLEMTGQVNISGPDSTTNVEIGSKDNDANAGTGGTSIAIGNGASNSGNAAQSIAIGNTAANVGSGTRSIAIGSSASTNTTGQGIAIGFSSTVVSSNSIAIGPSSAQSGSAGASHITLGNNITDTATGANVILVGNTCAASGASANVVALGPVCGPVAGTTNVFTAGSDGFGMSDVYFGEGQATTTAAAYTLHGTGGSGSDNAGAAVKIAGGFGTGTAAGGDVVLQRSPSIATGSTAQTATDALYVRSQKKALTDGVATAIVRISIPQGVAGLTGWSGGSLFYTVVANDATNYQSRIGSVNFGFVNEAGTEACAIGTPAEVDNTPTGTLTAAVTAASNAADTCDLLLNAASSLTETTLAAFYTVILNGPGTVTPQ